MAKSRQIVVMKPAPPGKAPGELVPLGAARDVRATLAKYNTASDGSPIKPTASTEVLHGPGMTVEFARHQDEINQLMVTMYDEDSAWSVLSRLCRAQTWRMVDPETGRSFG